MEFAAIPPEIISGQMYSGPGSGPMLTAAEAWDMLATELLATADSYGSALRGLTAGSWSGPSSEAMATATAPFVSWISAAATQARETAMQARAAAGAYEAAFAATVPPLVIAANRSQLATLLATNVFGQNTAAIAATEAQYREMWAQDAAAMYGYAASAAAAARLTPFTTPPLVTDAAGEAAQDAAVVASTGSATESALASSGASMYEDMFSTLASVTKFSTITNDTMSAPNLGMVQFKTFWKPPALPEIPKSGLDAGLGLGRSMSVGLRSAVSASVGEAPVVGSLSVPPGWATATPAIRLATNVIPETSVDSASLADVTTSALGAGALGSMTGGALGRSAPRVTSVRGHAGAGSERNAPVKLDRVLAQLQKSRDSVQHWQVDPAGLDDLLDELSKKPGFHAVHVAAGSKAKIASQE